MPERLHDLLFETAARHSSRPALSQKGLSLKYEDLAQETLRVAAGLRDIGMPPGERIGIFLPKSVEAVIAALAVSAAGGIFVPINPILRQAQLRHILRDCGATTLISTADRADLIGDTATSCPELKRIIWTNPAETASPPSRPDILYLPWEALRSSQPQPPYGGSRHKPVAIFYTSGSSGLPKGVVLSHINMATGARSVAQYLENHAEDRLLGLLPLSFDYGFSQVTTALFSGAHCHLMNYALPREVIDTIIQERITGLAAVPTLWSQLVETEWPSAPHLELRYITNSGGRIPLGVLTRLRSLLPTTKLFLMYGFTEAFRSTYLPPAELEHRPESIGKAIPEARVMVLRPDGTECAPGEAGELVHEGPLVSMGYWRQPEATRKLYGGTAPEPPSTRRAWSGDIVKRDQDGFFYYIGRRDQLIKTSGYRVSPNEIEEVIFASNLVASAAVTGLPHDMLGQSIEALVIPKSFDPETLDAILGYLRRELPRYMLPSHVVVTAKIPLTPHGKIDYPAVNSHLNSLLLSSTDIPLSSTDRPPILLTTT